MAKWFGKIGYSVTMETEPGIWEPKIEEREYYGEVTNFRKTIQGSGEINDTFIIKNGLSIIADPFVMDNLSNIIYAEFMGTKWKITDIEIQYPRILLSLGGVYNGEQA